MFICLKKRKSIDNICLNCIKGLKEIKDIMFLNETYFSF